MIMVSEATVDEKSTSGEMVSYSCTRFEERNLKLCFSDCLY